MSLEQHREPATATWSAHRLIQSRAKFRRKIRRWRDFGAAPILDETGRGQYTGGSTDPSQLQRSPLLATAPV